MCVYMDFTSLMLGELITVYVCCMLSWEQYFGTDSNCDVNILRCEHPLHESFHSCTQGRVPHYFPLIQRFKQEVNYCYFCNTEDCHMVRYCQSICH
jgi:hypothetical protein